MFGWLFGGNKRLERLEGETKNSFSSVKKDFEGVGTWIKHLDARDKQLNDLLSELKIELSSIKDDLEGVKEAVSLTNFVQENKPLSKKQTAVDKQTPVYAVQEPVQTPVQTGNFYEYLHGLSSNERLLVYTLLNTGEDMKLSYEDLARLLGKERSTVRGQINSIKQKSEGLIKEVREPSGKKRVYIADEMKEKMAKYAKVRAGKKREYKKLPKD
jgi:predicted transcriptional regulator